MQRQRTYVSTSCLTIRKKGGRQENLQHLDSSYGVLCKNIDIQAEEAFVYYFDASVDNFITILAPVLQGIHLNLRLNQTPTRVDFKNS